MAFTSFATLAVLLGAAVAIPGGYFPIDAKNDATAFKALRFAEHQVNEASNEEFLLKVDKVIKAEAQVVAGMNYRFNIHLAKTTCRREELSENFDFSRCPVMESDVPYLHVPGMVCTVVVNNPITKPGSFGVLSKKCFLERGLKKRSAVPVGGFQPVEVENDQTAFETLEFAINKINSDVQKSDNYLYDVDKVIVAERQVVSGLLFHFKLHMAKTTCTKSMLTPYFEMSRCPLMDSEIPGLHVPGMVCDVQVHVPPHVNMQHMQDENSSVSLKNPVCYYER